MVTAERLLNTDLQHGGYKKTMLGFSFQLGIFPRDGQVPPALLMAQQPSGRPRSSRRLLVLQLFVNNVQINSSNLVSGNGVIHGLSQVLSIIYNRCNETTYLRFRVMSTDSNRQQLRLCWNQELTLVALQGSCVDCSRSKMCPNDTVPDVRILTFSKQQTEKICGLC